MKYNKHQILKAIKHWERILESIQLNEFGPSWNINNMRDVPYEKCINKKGERPDYHMWSAAQLPLPAEDKHGKLSACEVVKAPGARDPLKEYYVVGHYADGTMLHIGPIGNAEAKFYIQLHELSANKKAWVDFNAHGYKNLTHNEVKSGDKVEIVKFPNGFYLRVSDGRKTGPFDSKILARTYALANNINFGEGVGRDKVEPVKHLNYPAFAFSYKMAGIDCMDIVCAEDINSAMKRFDFLWRVFDNTRPIRQVFTSIQELASSLRMLRITDIDIIELDNTNVDEYTEIAEETGNPSTIPQLRSRCRNSKFRYLLGRDKNTGRSPVKINW